MKILVAAAACALLAFSLSDFAGATTPPDSLYEVATVDQVMTDVNLDLSAANAIHAAGYHALADGGEGLFIKTGNSPCSGQDGGFIIKDNNSTKHCWQRQNLNGDLRQYGVTKGSSFDCSGAAIKTCGASDTLLSAMQSAAQSLGLTGLTTSGVQILLSGSSSFAVQPNMTVDAGNAAPSVSDSTITTPGTIWTGTPTSPNEVLILRDNATLRRAAVLPLWYGQYIFDHHPMSLADQYYIAQQMTNLSSSTSGTGISCSGQNCGLDHVLVAAFDTAIEVTGGSTYLNEVDADGNVCFYVHGIGSATHWGRTSCGLFATNAGSSTQPYDITAVQDDGTSAHNCELTISDTSLIQSSYNIWVSGLTTSTGANANGRWKPTVLDSTHLTLNGSQCHDDGTGKLTGADIHADFNNGSNVLRIHSGYSNTNITEGQKVVGTGIPSGTTVVAVGSSNGLIALSQAVTQNGSNVDVQFYSNTGGMFSTCQINSDVGSVGSCLMLTAQERVDAGTSGGGLAAGGPAGGAGCATAYLIGGFNSADTPAFRCHTGDTRMSAEKVSGFDAYSPFCYARAICYHFANAYNARITSSGMDATRNLADDDTAFALVDGNFKGLTFLGGKAGKIGAGLIVDPTGSDKGCLNVESSNLSIYEVDQGCLLVRGADSPNLLMVSDAAIYVQMNGYSPNMKVFYENHDSSHIASSIADTSTSLTTSGASWWGGHFSPGGFSPAVTGTGSTGSKFVSGNDSVGRFTSSGSLLANPIVTFAHAWPVAPVCRAIDETHTATQLNAATTTSVLTISPQSGSIVSGDSIGYTCEAYSN